MADKIKSALSLSLQAEEESVKARFAKAESLLSDKLPSASNHQKVIRDSFTAPSKDYELIEVIKNRCLKLAINVTKSEVIRAGLWVLVSLSEEELKLAMESLEKVKTGRPK